MEPEVILHRLKGLFEEVIECVPFDLWQCVTEVESNDPNVRRYRVTSGSSHEDIEVRFYPTFHEATSLSVDVATIVEPARGRPTIKVAGNRFTYVDVTDLPLTRKEQIVSEVANDLSEQIVGALERMNGGVDT